MTLAGVLMAIGAVAMLWVNPPDEADESPIMPLGSKRSITVYDRVVVGSDGTPTSLYAVDRAAEVAQAAQARLVVVTAYREGDASTAPTAGRRDAPRPLRCRGGPQGPGQVGRRAHQGAGEIHRAAARPRGPGAGAARHGRRRTRRTSSSSATAGWAPARGSCWDRFRATS